jgi:hypothetical protein
MLDCLVNRFLAEYVADFLVYVAQEVDVGRSAVSPFVLHQEVVEPWFQFVTLAHNGQLATERVVSVNRLWLTNSTLHTQFYLQYIQHLQL